VVLGIGDDAAAWRPSRSHLSVITTDALIDGVHFTRGEMTAAAIGHRAMAANLSDIAAMGARPVLATVALGVAPATTESWILESYRGMASLAGRYGARIVGGDLTRAPALTLALTLVGEVSPSRLKRRDAGRPGDVVAVTGPLGASRAGLELLRRPELALTVAPAAAFTAADAFAMPLPRMQEGRFLAASGSVRAMLDSSDGLSTDLGRLARASGCGATVDAVPVHPAAAAIAAAAGARPEDYALHGGEDFELIVSIEPRAYPHLARRFAQRFGKPLIAIGHLDREAGVRLLDPGVNGSTGEKRPLIAAGWDHFS
jgi:thiamine-monophosphate kinase